MKPTEELKKEHEAIKIGLDVLERMAVKIESGEDIDLDHIERMLDFIRTFADKCHHGKEEDKLFPAMIGSGIPGEGGPISVMLAEHEIGRGHVKLMGEAITGIKNGKKDSMSQLTTNARGYVDLLRDHIYKEDNILYPMADRHLSEKAQEELSVDFDRVEKEIIGEGKHEEYHEMLKEMRKEYL